MSVNLSGCPFSFCGPRLSIMYCQNCTPYCCIIYYSSSTEFDLSVSLNVKCNVTVEFLLVSNSKALAISHGLGVICTWKVPYHFAKIPDKWCTNRIISSGSAAKATTKNKVDWQNTFIGLSITINPAQYNKKNAVQLVSFNGIAAISVCFVRRICSTCCTWGQCILNLYVNN